MQEIVNVTVLSDFIAEKDFIFDCVIYVVFVDVSVDVSPQKLLDSRSDYVQGVQIPSLLNSFDINVFSRTLWNIMTYPLLQVTKNGWIFTAA